MAAFNAPDDGGSGPDNGVYKDSDDISSTSQPALELPEADAIQNGGLHSKFRSLPHTAPAAWLHWLCSPLFWILGGC